MSEIVSMTLPTPASTPPRSAEGPISGERCRCPMPEIEGDSAQEHRIAVVRAAVEALAPELSREAVDAALRLAPPGTRITAGMLVGIAAAIDSLAHRAGAKNAAP